MTSTRLDDATARRLYGLILRSQKFRGLDPADAPTATQALFIKALRKKGEPRTHAPGLEEETVFAGVHPRGEDDR